ncbi:MAG: hypothetical protein CVU51_05960 [Deltaproteobacteria bacterium HGW-Deltaproteobacteria-1]|jgi:hypothetical protein|nr:MAG: hypothetical protein CVU51_05960 [Deltaproteobacteria bacterium HGW-Deltaproteobacteria-1]
MNWVAMTHSGLITIQRFLLENNVLMNAGTLAAVLRLKEQLFRLPPGSYPGYNIILLIIYI